MSDDYTVEMNMEDDKAEFPWVTSYRGHDLKPFRTRAEADAELARITHGAGAPMTATMLGKPDIGQLCQWSDSGGSVHHGRVLAFHDKGTGSTFTIQQEHGAPVTVVHWQVHMDETFRIGLRKELKSPFDWWPKPCPECAAGKHNNCDGRTWDIATDAHVECPCSRAGHKHEGDLHGGMPDAGHPDSPENDRWRYGY